MEQRVLQNLERWQRQVVLLQRAALESRRKSLMKVNQPSCITTQPLIYVAAIISLSLLFHGKDKLVVIVFIVFKYLFFMCSTACETDMKAI